MGSGPLDTGHAIDEIERRPHISDVLISGFQAYQYVVDLVVHDLRRATLADPVEQAEVKDCVGKAHLDGEDREDHI